MSVTRIEVLPAQIVTTVAVYSDSQAAIRETVHLDSWLWRQLPRTINKPVTALHAQIINAAIHWVPVQSGITGNNKAGCQVNMV
jgi:hypothetical protein